MVSRLFLIYAVVELAVIFALVATIGWGWTLLALLGTFLLGWGIIAPLAGSRLLRQIGRLRSGLTEQRAAAGDGALVSLAILLVLAPGLTAMAVRKLQRQGLSYASAIRPEPYSASYPTFDGRGHGDYIDGEVIDVRDVEAPARPQRSDGR